MIRLSAIGAVVGVLACAAVVGAQAAQPERLIMVKEADRPAQKCRVLKCWKEKGGTRVCQVQAVDTGEMMTIVEEGGAPGGSSAPPAPKPALARTKVIHWGGQTTCPTCAPAPPADAIVIGKPQPPASPALLDRMFASSRPRVSTQSKVTSVPPATAQKQPAQKQSGVKEKREWVMGKPNDWRDSWGQVERLSDADAKKAAEVAAARAEETRPSSAKADPVARVEKEEKPAKAAVKADVTKPEADRKGKPAETKPAESKPLLGMFGRGKEGKKVELPPRKIEGRPVVPTRVAPMKDGPSLWERITGGERTDATPADPVRGGPPGMASWSAAATTPPAPVLRPGTVSVPASARNAFTEMMPGVRPGQMPPMPMMMPEAGVPVSMGNAFTSGGTSRPIPSDMGRAYHNPNALQGQGSMGGAESRPPFPTGYYLPMPAMAALPQPAMMPPMPPVMPNVMPVSAVMPVEQPSPLAVLKGSILPSQREMAVEQLGRCDWRRQPEVLEGLIKSAKSDPAPSVRAACVRALGRMKANTMPVVAAVTSLKADPDVRVRQEAEQTLSTLSK